MTHTAGPLTSDERYIYAHGDDNSTIIGMALRNSGSLEEAIANARLWAAAPDLLSLAMEVSTAPHNHECELRPGHDKCTCFVGRARSIITKAKTL